jgi:hypothetical protein
MLPPRTLFLWLYAKAVLVLVVVVVVVLVLEKPFTQRVLKYLRFKPRATV